MKTFWDGFFKFLAPFWEAFWRQNLKKGSPKSDEKVDAFLGGVLGLKWTARRDARGVWDWNLAEFGRIWHNLR